MHRSATQAILAQRYPDLNRYLLPRFGFQTLLLQTRMLTRSGFSDVMRLV
jgi:hypothetical protein